VNPQAGAKTKFLTFDSDICEMERRLFADVKRPVSGYNCRLFPVAFSLMVLQSSRHLGVDILRLELPMRSCFVLAIAVLIAVGGCRNQVSERQDTTASDENRFVAAGTQVEIDAQAKDLVNSVTQALQSGLIDLEESVKAAEDDQEKVRLYNEKNPVPTFLEESSKLVENFPASPATFEIALQSLAYSTGDQRDSFLGYLLNQWPQRLDHQKIVDYLLKQVPSETIEGFLKKSIAGSPEGMVHASSLLAFKTYLDQKPVFSDTLRKSTGIEDKLPAAQLAYIHAARNESQIESAAAYLQTIIDKYSGLDFTSNGMSGGETYGQVARQHLFELQNLNIGQIAPDIAGNDLDGVPFKLSDYRGKVVMLDFWGHWCPPCRRMYPHERQLVKDLAGMPFALIGVNSDPNIETARKAVAEDPLPWRNFWNGPEGTAGPISSQWNVSAWPTFYLIDGDGVIRYKGVHGDDLRLGIEKMLTEMGHKLDLQPINVASR